jgi:hypothetical protein
MGSFEARRRGKRATAFYDLTQLLQRALSNVPLRFSHGGHTGGAIAVFFCDRFFVSALTCRNLRGC